jgi:hypothetical protein
MTRPTCGQPAATNSHPDGEHPGCRAGRLAMERLAPLAVAAETIESLRARVAELEVALAVTLCWCPACDGSRLGMDRAPCVVCGTARAALAGRKA